MLRCCLAVRVVRMQMKRIRYIDSHTGGEPTRLVLDGVPDLGVGDLAHKRDVLRLNHDGFRLSINTEPRGNDVLVGAIMAEPADSSCSLGVVFFNNVGYLGMCGHGTIGLVASLSYLGWLRPGRHRIETPVGVVEAELHETQNGDYANRVSVRNVPSYRHSTNVKLDVAGLGAISGDVAYGGNWFFLTHDHGQALHMGNLAALTNAAARIREALKTQGICGADDAEIDHIELLGPSEIADSKGFMLCPGNAYDRSPCGTGTSAKLACLYEDGKLKPGAIWRHEGIVGSVFSGTVEVKRGVVTPTITGEAWVMGDGYLLVDPRDPFAAGIA
jgi:4-hydroxyproline epimerase